MINTVLECIYNVLRSYPEAPFNSRVIADTCQLTIDDVQIVLDQLISNGLLVRKQGLSNTYQLSPEGLTKAKAYYKAVPDVTDIN
jgi:predicted transcriptional regulator